MIVPEPTLTGVSILTTASLIPSTIWLTEGVGVGVGSGVEVGRTVAVGLGVGVDVGIGVGLGTGVAAAWISPSLCCTAASTVAGKSGVGVG